MIPDSIRFLLIIGGLIGGVYAAAWMLASMPPQPKEVVKELSNAPLKDLP